MITCVCPLHLILLINLYKIEILTTFWMRGWDFVQSVFVHWVFLIPCWMAMFLDHFSLMQGSPMALPLDLHCFLSSSMTFVMWSVPNYVFILMIQIFNLVFIVSPIVLTKLVASLRNYLQSIVNQGKDWLVNFNVFKTKLLSFKHHSKVFLPIEDLADAS